MNYNTVNVDSATSSSQLTSAEDLLDLGIKYCIGRGVEQSNVMAHMWFNIAALKGSESARHYRAEVSREMSANEIAEAQRKARAWLTVH